MTTLLMNNLESYTDSIDALAINDALDVNDELLQDYERYLMLTTTNSNATKETYMHTIKHFFNWLNEENINHVDEYTLANYKSHLISKYQASSVNTFIIGLKKFYAFLEKKNITNYAKDIKGIKTSRNHKRGALTIKQVKAIYDAIDTSTLEGKRENAIFRLLITGGLRTCEVVRANIGDIKNKDECRVLYVQGKGRDTKDEFVRLSPNTEDAINDYLTARGITIASEPLFTSLSDRNNGERLQTRTVRNIVKNLYHRVGIYDADLTTHSTRHSAITFAIKSGKSLLEVKDLARHSNINTTMIYSHNNDKLNANCEGAIEKLIEG